MHWMIYKLPHFHLTQNNSFLLIILREYLHFDLTPHSPLQSGETNFMEMSIIDDHHRSHEVDHSPHRDRQPEYVSTVLLSPPIFHEPKTSP